MNDCNGVPLTPGCAVIIVRVTYHPEFLGRTAVYEGPYPEESDRAMISGLSTGYPYWKGPPHYLMKITPDPGVMDIKEAEVVHE